jgi:membrane protein required for colicin V production
VSIFTPLFSSAVQRSALGGVDQALGFLFGVARGVILVAIAFVAYHQVMANAAVPVVDKSRSASVFAKFQQSIAKSMPSDAPGWIVQRYETLVGTCGSAIRVAPSTAPATTAPGSTAGN